ncbi:MAG: response regulator [Deltaproteobacteria bacterium]|nr:response regulator [Deltaproteobacteria bacterium]
MPQAFREEKKPKKILVVDDQKIVRHFMTTVLERHGYQFQTADNGIEGIARAKELKPDLIYLDLMMPLMDGFETCRTLKKDPLMWHIPIIMITASSDRDSRLKALDCGVNDFLNKPVDPVELMLRTKNLLRVKEFDDFLREYTVVLDAEVRKRTESLNSTNAALSDSRRELKQGYIDTVHKLTMIAEHKDVDTAAHIKRVGYLSAFLAGVIGWDQDGVETIFYASPMHDIGKVAIPADILLKPGKLTREEFVLMKTHASVGASILKGSQSSILRMAERIAFTHHERWDGGGYPSGVKAAEIPVEGSIMNIVDQYDALRSHRPYKPPFSHAKAVEIITQGNGRTEPAHFNPVIMAAFKDNHKEFARIYDEHSAGERTA